MTSAELTDLWLAKRGLRVSEEVRTVMRKRIGAALISSRARGVLANVGEFDILKGWVVA
jgi:hypothetical protein